MTIQRPHTDRIIIPALASWFGVQPMTARVLWALYQSQRCMTHHAIRQATGVETSMSAAVHVSYLRGAMELGAITPTGEEVRQGSAPRALVALTDSGRKEVRDALEIMYGELADVFPDAILRTHIARVAGLLAARSGCYNAATVLRRIADALLVAPRRA